MFRGEGQQEEVAVDAALASSLEAVEASVAVYLTASVCPIAQSTLGRPRSP